MLSSFYKLPSRLWWFAKLVYLLYFWIPV